MGQIPPNNGKKLPLRLSN